ncbi:MAG: HAD family hydrolase [Lachnospiraceae bacterium]|nr:HAD family hydrolase [Lachnospiraceae bacterium]
MNNQTKLLFADIDGTLIQPDQTLSPSVTDMLKQMANAGHGLILSSGRPLGSILRVYGYILEQIQSRFSHAFIIANNGAQVYDCECKRNILEKRLPLSLVDDLQKLADAYHVHIQTYTETHIIAAADDAETKSYLKKIILPVMISEKLTDALDLPPYKMLALSLSGSDYLMPFKKALTREYGDQVSSVFSGSGYLEIIQKGADKGNALRHVAGHLQVPIENTYSAGDSENDIPMLLAAGHGYAMANADTSVRSQAPFVTAAPFDQDGICEVIRNLLEN